MKSRMLMFLLVVVTSSLTIAAQKAPELTPAEKEVRKLERSWLDAYEKRDVAAMTAIVADDFTITFPDGSMQTKRQTLDSLIINVGGGQKFTTENVQSRVYGDTVILIGVVVSEWKVDDKPGSNRSRYTDTYVKRNGKWQVVASHLSSAGKN